MLFYNFVFKQETNLQPKELYLEPLAQQDIKGTNSIYSCFILHTYIEDFLNILTDV